MGCPIPSIWVVCSLRNCLGISSGIGCAVGAARSPTCVLNSGLSFTIVASRLKVCVGECEREWVGDNKRLYFWCTCLLDHPTNKGSPAHLFLPVGRFAFSSHLFVKPFRPHLRTDVAYRCNDVHPCCVIYEITSAKAKVRTWYSKANFREGR